MVVFSVNYTHFTHKYNSTAYPSRFSLSRKFCKSSISLKIK